MHKIKYKGRTVTSARSLVNAMMRDVKNEVARKTRQTASSSGVHVRKTHKGFELKGDTSSMRRFNSLIGR